MSHSGTPTPDFRFRLRLRAIVADFRCYLIISPLAAECAISSLIIAFDAFFARHNNARRLLPCLLMMPFFIFATPLR